MRHAPSLFFLLCLLMLCYVSLKDFNADETVVNILKKQPYERSYEIDLTRGNWTLQDIDVYLPKDCFQILKISDGLYWYSVLERETLKDQMIATYHINNMRKEAWYRELHDIKINYVIVVTEEENIKKLMRKYEWIEYI